MGVIKIEQAIMGDSERHVAQEETSRASNNSRL